MPIVDFTDPESQYQKYIDEIRVRLDKKRAYFHVHLQNKSGQDIEAKVRLKDLLDDPAFTPADKLSSVKFIRYILAYGLEVDISKIPTNPFDTDDIDP